MLTLELVASQQGLLLKIAAFEFWQTLRLPLQALLSVGLHTDCDNKFYHQRCLVLCNELEKSVKVNPMTVNLLNYKQNNP